MQGERLIRGVSGHIFISLVISDKICKIKSLEIIEERLDIHRWSEFGSDARLEVDRMQITPSIINANCAVNFEWAVHLLVQYLSYLYFEYHCSTSHHEQA